jgi:hypothetical protein
MDLLKKCLLGLLSVTTLSCSSASTRDKKGNGSEHGALSAPDAGISAPGVRFAWAPTDVQWAPTNWPAGNAYFALHAKQDWAFARIWDAQNGGRVFLSVDNGATWAQIASADSDIDIRSLTRLGSDILAGTWDGFYVSTTGGASWTPITPTGIPAGTAIWTIAEIDASLFAASVGHVYKSVDNGNTWAEVSSGIPSTAIPTSFVAMGGAVLVGTDSSGVLKTTNGGTTWSAVNSGLTDTRLSQLAAVGSRLLAVTQSGVFVSDNGGTSWAADASSPANVNCFLATNEGLLAGTEAGGVYLSVDSGATWTSSSSGLPDGTRVWSLAAGGDSVFAGTDSGVWRMATVANDPPTVVTAAAASPNPITGQTTSLSVLGDDDGGEASLIYTWSTLGTPPAPVGFSSNGTNAAKNTIATFAQAGSYTLQATMRDQLGRTATSAVVVTVEQTSTGVVVSPASVTLAPLATQAFVATAQDQFGMALATQPTFSWSVDGGGAIDGSGLFTASSTAGGPFTVTATGGASTGTASVMLVAPPSTVYQINTGSSSAPTPFAADQYGTGGTMRTVSNAITTSGVSDPAPMAVYQSERYGNSTYTLPNLTAGSQYTVRLHFAELYWTATGRRSFNVVINGTTALSGFDIYAVAGDRYKAVVREFTTNANSSGQIVIAFQTVTDNATIEGIEIIAATPNAPPAIATAASATPNPVTGTTAALSTLGVDDGGEASLTYTWATTGTPPAPVSFGANGSNAAKNTTATFTKAGSYTLQVTVRDQPGLTATSVVTVTVDQTLTSVVVAPASATVTALGTQQFVATGRDQFATALVTQPAFAWSASGGGVVDGNGLFTAGVIGGGPYTVTAQSGAVSGSAAVSVVVPNVGPTIASPATSNPNPVTGSSASLSVLGADDAGEANLTYTWAVTGTPPAPVSFSANGDNAAKNTIATFTKAGSYSLQVTVRDQPGLTVTSVVAVTVVQTVTSIAVAPASSTLGPLATQQFVATASDQFASPLLVQPSFTWSATGGGAIDSTGLFTAGTTAGGPYLVTAQSGAVSGSATVTVVIPNAAPTIVTGPSASPDLVTGSTTSLAVLGGDDGGEANLIYTWATIGTPPAPVTFSANASNAAKNTTATFTKAGSYTLQVTVADQPGLSATSSITVTVEQTPTSIVVSPASATVNTSASQQFTASARDQFGANLATQPTFTWTTSGGGGIGSSGLFTAGAIAGGPFTVTATSGGVSGTASVTVASTPTTIYQINAGSNSAASPFTADQYVSGGTLRTISNTIAISGITDPAPMAVYQSERYGTSTYTLPNLTAGNSYTVRLHFAELYWTETGRRRFNVAINGATVLSSFDIYAAAGARYKAVLREFTATANASGQIVINFTTVTDNATIEGIEIIALAPNNPPSITTAASATPNPVVSATTSLSALGADDGGEASLIYTWATTGTPPAAVTFSANGTNAAKNTTATFSKAGNYTLQVTAQDQPGLTATSSVVVTVAQTLTSIVVTPSSATVEPLSTQQFAATARDQFSVALATQPTFAWSVSGGGTIDGSGLFAPNVSAGGPYTVTAQSGGVGGTATISVATPNAGPTIATPAAASPSPVTGSTTSLSALGADDAGEANLTYTWATIGTPPAAVTFGANGTNAAKSTTASFTKSGSYSFQVTVRDQPGLTATSSVNVTVNQTLTSIVVAPSSATVNTSATQQFTATGRDQFATSLATQPTFTWSTSGGGSISSNGLFSAGAAAGGPYTVTAASGGVSGTASVTVTGGGSTPCAGLCTNPVVFTTQYYQSGNLGTGATCHETTANLSSGNCSNISTRTLTVNGATMSCNGWSLPAKRNGGYCVQVTAGQPSYTSFATW